VNQPRHGVNPPFDGVGVRPDIVQPPIAFGAIQFRVAVAQAIIRVLRKVLVGVPAPGALRRGELRRGAPTERRQGGAPAARRAPATYSAAIKLKFFWTNMHEEILVVLTQDKRHRE
jgi:hypothetical protein